MPLNALPVTADELEDLQFGLSFTTNTAQATSQAALINLDNGVDTVASYAAALLNANIATSQVAMATTCLMWGATQDTALLENTASVAAPVFIALAIQLGTNQVVTAAEGIGVALADDAQFAPFLALNETQFATAVAAATGVNVTQINLWLANWIDFYTTFGTPGAGVTVQEAAYGATFGDAIGVALLNPTSADLQTVIVDNPDGTISIEGEIANALLTIATGQYVVGIPCDQLPDHTQLQGEAPGLTLTINIDNIETSLDNAVFVAPPGGNAPLGTTNTLNTGDTLVSTVGNATLNFTAVNNFLANPAFATGVTMTGIATANILNLTNGIDPNVIAGFAGDITGLTTLRIEEGSNIIGFVQAGLTGLGLNTALETLNINAGGIFVNTADPTDPLQFGADVSIWIESSAFAGGEVLDVNLDGNGVGSYLTLNTSGGNNFYETVNVSSVGTGPNHLVVSTNADTVTTVTVDGDQDLRICGESFPAFGIHGLLDQDTLTTFDASAATGDVTAFFEGENAGAVDVIGGTGDDNFWFLVTDPIELNRPPLGQDDGPTTFTADDSVDGGDGTNTLTLQAFEGALLGTGVGDNIVNITRITHSTLFDPCLFFDDNCIFNPMQGDLTVDMARSGSATELELAGAYGDPFVLFAAVDVDVTNLENGDTVIFSGTQIATLTLEHVSGAGTFNLVMAQDPCVEDFFGPVTHVIDAVDTESGAFLNIVSTGNADENAIIFADRIDTDIEATGDVNLSIAGIVDNPDPTINGGDPFIGSSYDFDGGLVNASELEGDLFLATGFGNQRVFTGSGDDFVVVNAFIQNPGATFDNDLVDLSTGGSDSVQFDGVFFGDFGFLSPTGANYNEVLGFDVADDTIVMNPNLFAMSWLVDTLGFDVANGEDPLVFQYSTGTNLNATSDFFNFIKVIDPVNVGAFGTAEFGFEQAIDTGSIQVSGVAPFAEYIAGSYFDATNTQAVLFNITDADGDSFITANDAFVGGFAVMALVDMTQADYTAFGADNLSFTPFQVT